MALFTGTILRQKCEDFSNDNILSCPVGKICVGLPFMRKIGLCGHLYHIDGHFSPMVYLRACLTVTVASMFEVRFYCLDATQTSKGDGSFLSETFKLETVSVSHKPPVPKFF